MSKFIIVLLLALIAFSVVAKSASLEEEILSDLYQELSADCDIGNQAAAFAQSQVGGCYSQANRLGNPCFDCSGLVYMSYQNAGVTVPITSASYPDDSVYDVTGQDLQVGDILWRQGHVVSVVLII